MTQLSASARYSRVAMALHWIIALLILVNFGLALAWDGVSKPAAEALMANHKAVGILVLLLSLARLAWRLGHRPPADLPMQPWESKLAHAMHWLLYVFMIGLPIGGWLSHSAFSGGQPLTMFGLFPFPGLPLAQSKEMGHTFGDLHGTGAWVMAGLLGLHLAGALKHQFIDRQPELQRMLPWG